MGLHKRRCEAPVFIVAIVFSAYIGPCSALLLSTGASPGHRDTKTSGGEKAIATAAKQVARLPMGCTASEDCECYRNPKEVPVRPVPSWRSVMAMSSMRCPGGCSVLQLLGGHEDQIHPGRP
mmetsp:Transcript_62739/g.116658  ORF Transcript_62739/g.116658 Transcript_62739/m.116658 type:complete len:122 (+) Transcript_62739:83-448(+)